jgi:hypothetical protein
LKAEKPHPLLVEAGYFFQNPGNGPDTYPARPELLAGTIQARVWTAAAGDDPAQVRRYVGVPVDETSIGW